MISRILGHILGNEYKRRSKSCPYCNFSSCWLPTPSRHRFSGCMSPIQSKLYFALQPHQYRVFVRTDSLTIFKIYYTLILLFNIIYLGLCLSFTLIYDLEPNMPRTQAPHPSLSSLPLAVPEKIVFYSPTASQVPISRYLTSRPQPGSSANSSAAPSLTSCSNTCRTTTDCETQNRAYPTIDLAEMLKTRLSSDMDTLALDRSLVRQAQT